MSSNQWEPRTHLAMAKLQKYSHQGFAKKNQPCPRLRDKIRCLTPVPARKASIPQKNPPTHEHGRHQKTKEGTERDFQKIESPNSVSECRTSPEWNPYDNAHQSATDIVFELSASNSSNISLKCLICLRWSIKSHEVPCRQQSSTCGPLFLFFFLGGGLASGTTKQSRTHKCPAQVDWTSKWSARVLLSQQNPALEHNAAGDLVVVLAGLAAIKSAHAHSATANLSRYEPICRPRWVHGGMLQWLGKGSVEATSRAGTESAPMQEVAPSWL